MNVTWVCGISDVIRALKWLQSSVRKYKRSHGTFCLLTIWIAASLHKQEVILQSSQLLLNAAITLLTLWQLCNGCNGFIRHPFSSNVLSHTDEEVHIGWWEVAENCLAVFAIHLADNLSDSCCDMVSHDIDWCCSPERRGLYGWGFRRCFFEVLNLGQEITDLKSVCVSLSLPQM